MGDFLDEDDYIKEKIEENEHSEWQQSDDDEGAESGGDQSDEEDVDNRKKEEKKLKRKQKFAVMKEKKRQKLETSDNDENLDQLQLSTDEMITALLQHMPESFIATSKHSGNEFELSDFFSPILPSATESLTKAPNPFIRALSVGLPNYKKLLLGSSNNSGKKGTKEDNKTSTLTSNDYGCPVVLIICASANRATEIVKSISARLIKCKIGKLFAKHFKITEQIELLSKEIYPVCIGTPNRLNKLIEMGALHLSKVKAVLIDSTP
jgi:hypothetical protein